MKKTILIACITSLFFACNTKQGTNEPTVDSELNPAELPVDSIGAGNDMVDRSSSDSNHTGAPHRPSGKSDLQVGTENESGKTLSSDGNIVDKKESNKKELPAKNK